MIPIDQCKNGYLYYIKARNGHFGVYVEEDKTFALSREKFGSNYVFPEYHWETGEPFGTVKPIKEIERAPESILESEEAALVYLNNFELGYYTELAECIKGADIPVYLEKSEPKKLGFGVRKPLPPPTQTIRKIDWK